MSTTSPQQKAASETAAWQAQLAQMLSGVAVPELQMLLGGRSYTPESKRWVTDTAATGDRVRTSEDSGAGPGGHWETVPASWGEQTQGLIPSMLAGRDASGRLPQDAAILAAATRQLNQGYGQAAFGQQQAIGYGGLRSGEGRLSPGAMNASMRSAATTLEQQRIAALNNLNFMSAQSSMTDYNKLLGLMGQGVQTSLGLAQGFSGAQSAALGGLSTQTQMGSTLGGAAAGAGLGATVGGPYGAIIGGVAGGAAGYFGGGG